MGAYGFSNAPVPRHAPKPKKYTKAELKAMNKSQQISLLRSLGFRGRIPRYEKDRIDKILELM